MASTAASGGGRAVKDGEEGRVVGEVKGVAVW